MDIIKNVSFKPSFNFDFHKKIYKATCEYNNKVYDTEIDHLNIDRITSYDLYIDLCITLNNNLSNQIYSDIFSNLLKNI